MQFQQKKIIRWHTSLYGGAPTLGTPGSATVPTHPDRLFLPGEFNYIFALPTLASPCTNNPRLCAAGLRLDLVSSHVFRLFTFVVNKQTKQQQFLLK